MTSEPNESSEEAGAPPAGTAESLTRPGAAPGHDVSRAIGYEAADPSLHAPLWSEAMKTSDHNPR